MTRTTLKPPMVLDQIMAALEDYDGDFQRSLWPEYVKMYGRSPMLGEIRAQADWHNVPHGRPLRIVAVRDEDGLVIRWLDSDYALNTNGTPLLYHEEMVCVRDRGKTVRSGYMTFEPSGELLITG